MCTLVVITFPVLLEISKCIIPLPQFLKYYCMGQIIDGYRCVRNNGSCLSCPFGICMLPFPYYFEFILQANRRLNNEQKNLKTYVLVYFV